MGAFGKDREVLKKVTNMREASNISRGRRPPKGGGGTWQRYANQYKPSMTEAELIRFIAGEHPYEGVLPDGSLQQFSLPYFRFTEHFDGRLKKSCICSAGPYASYKEKRDPCLGCDIFWESGGSKGGRMSRRDQWSFTVLNYGTFHEVDETDQNGNVKINDKTKKPYTKWEKCAGRRCDACAAGRPTKRGHVQHYEVGFGHFSSIKEYSKFIGKCCRSCGSKDSIQALAYICPECKDAVVDMSTTHMTDVEILKLVDNEVSCPHCRATVLLEEIVECSGCDNPERAGIFDVDISMQKVAGPDGTNQNTLMFTGFGPVCAIDPIYDAKPMELEKMFPPSTLEFQASQFQMKMPAAVPREPVPAASVSRAYATPPAQPQHQGAPAPQEPAATPPARPGGGMFSR